MRTVIKRNGVEMPYDKLRVVNAINKAFIKVDGKENNVLAYGIENRIYYSMFSEEKHRVSVEEIQNKVEEELMACERKDVARAYIRYRYKREIARERKNDFIKAISEKIKGSNIENQNANVDEMSFGGRIGAASDLMMKQYALDYCISDIARRNHLNNEIYIHDLSAYAVGSHNCLSIPFDDLLANGFNTRQTDVRPAGSVNTAFQLVAVIFQLQSLQQFGGVSATHLDWTMVPYVRKSFYKHYKDGLLYVQNLKIEFDKINNSLSIDSDIYKEYPMAYKYAIDMTEKEVHQAVEGLYHNLK